MKYQNTPRELPIRVPTRLKGHLMKVGKGQARDPLLIEVLDEEAAYQSEVLEVKVNSETILVNIALFPNAYTGIMAARLRENYKQLEKEKRNGQKLYVPRTYRKASKLGSTAQG